MGLMILAVLSVSSGLVLDTVTRGRREMKLLAYLSQAPLTAADAGEIGGGRDDGPRRLPVLSRAFHERPFSYHHRPRPPTTPRRSNACTSARSGPAASC